MEKLITALAAAASLSLAACGSQTGDLDSNHRSVQASAKASDSFTVARLASEAQDAAPAAETPAPNATFGTSDKMHLVIYKSALDKEFMLSASLIGQNITPTSNGLSTRIVAFKRHGDKVFLLEASKGHVVTRDLPSTLILAEIPIVSEKDDRIELDFNAGMRHVFIAGSLHVSDFQGSRYDAWTSVANLEISNSFIDSIKLNADRLEIRQLVQAKMQGLNTDSMGIDTYSPSFEARYFLSPYQPSATYAAKESSTRNFDRVGYWEAPPVLEEVSGRSSMKIARWDASKPVVYHISANTPAEYVNAVKEGILYWNKAFGKEIVQAELAPPGATAPDPDYNLVQWVPWDNAGYAYADALIDPRSGEIRHAQVYMTSAFAFYSKARLRNLLRAYRAAEDYLRAGDKMSPKAQFAAGAARNRKGADSGGEYDRQRLMDAMDPQKNLEGLFVYKGISLQFMQPARLCQFAPTEAAMAALGNVVSEPAIDDAALLRISQDYVRLIVAHEIGHTLGLRHNFAGNLAANVTIPQRDILFGDYLLNGTAPGKDRVFTSSVMDYLGFQDSVLSFAGKTGDALAYDKAAIQWGYNDQAMGEAAPLFCTDSHVSQGYLDCQPFDSGSSPIANWTISANAMVQQLPLELAELFMEAKAPADPRDAIPLDQVYLDPNKAALQVAKSLFRGLAFLSKEGRTIATARKNAVIDGMNNEELLVQELEYVKAQIQALGGVQAAYFGLLPAGKAAAAYGIAGSGNATLAESLKKRLKAYLARKDVRAFVGLDGKNHDFTDKEAALIEARSSRFFEKYEAALYAWLGVAFYSTEASLEFEALRSVPQEGLSVSLQSALASSAQELLFAKNGKMMTGQVAVGAGLRPKISVPLYAYGYKERRAIALMLSGGTVPVPSWGSSTRTSVSAQLQSELENSLGLHLSDVSESAVPNEMYFWLLEQKSVINTAQMGFPM